MGKDRITKSTRRQQMWFPWKHLHHNVPLVKLTKHALEDEELKKHLGSKISHVIIRAQQINDDDNEGDDDSLPIQIRKCSLDEIDDQGTNIFDCCELILPEKDLVEFSHSDSSLHEFSSKGPLELAAKKKRLLLHHQHHHTLEIDPVSDPQCAEFYSRVGTVMESVPALENPTNDIFLKGFKIIPLLSNWEEILLLTRPDLWCPEATYHATLVFLSFRKLHQLKSFLEHVLLKRSLEIIRTRGYLDWHLNLALRHVIHADPALFCKAIILPLSTSDPMGQCGLREASIFGGILSKTRIPSQVGSNILLALAQMSTHYLPSHSVFIIVLLEKNPVLPFRVLASLVDHFCCMNGRNLKLPLLWHQSLYLFVELYGAECVLEQKERLLETSQCVFHHHWSSLIGELVWKLIRRNVADSCQQVDRVITME